jgi:hypothetical protein
MINYIVAVYAKGILAKGDSKAMQTLQRKFASFDHIAGAQLHLSEKGFNEKIFAATAPQPLTAEDITRLKAAFDVEKRLVKIYQLSEV